MKTKPLTYEQLREHVTTLLAEGTSLRQIAGRCDDISFATIKRFTDGAELTGPRIVDLAQALGVTVVMNKTA